MESKKVQAIRKEYAFAMIFAIYLYIYASMATLTNKNSVGYIGTDIHLIMYYANQLVFVAGFLLNAFLWTKLTKDEHKSLYLKVSFVLMFLCSFIIILYPCAFSFLVMAPIVHLFLGIVGGSVNYFLASALFETGVIGRVVALGAAAAYLLQYFVQIMADNNLLLLVFIIAGGITLIPIVKNSWQWILLDYLPSETTDDSSRWTDKKALLYTSIIISMAATVLLSYCDSWFIQEMVAHDLQSVSTYTWPRLFMILGYLITGFAGDYKNGRFLNVTFFSIVLWLILCPVLLSDEVSISLIMVFFYVIVGAYMGYMYIMSLTLAPYTGKYSIIYSSSSRIIEGFVGVSFSFLPWNSMKMWHIIAIGIVSVSVILGAFARYIVFTRKSIDTTVDTSMPDDSISISNVCSIALDTDSETDSSATTGTGSVASTKVSAFSTDISSNVKGDEYLILDRISLEYRLTDREKAVFEKLIFTEDSGQEIADTLYISRRVLQRHVAAIYEKTGTKSRVGLFRIYHKMSTLIQQD